MAITAIGSAALKAYGSSIQKIQTEQQAIQAQMPKEPARTEGFSKTMSDSIRQVNDMQIQGEAMVQEFATGKNTNVHELMIHLQKAGLAVSLTSAVRNKVMTAYQEMMRMQM